MTALLKPQPVPAAEISTIVKAVTRTADLWNLRNADAAALFDVPIATWNRMKAGQFRGSLDRDKTMRASLIIGIFKGLRLLFNGPLEYGWPGLKNAGPLYDGRTPVEFMISGGIPAMMRVRDHVDAMRGGL
jgi:hypothetical protein